LRRVIIVGEIHVGGRGRPSLISQKGKTYWTLGLERDSSGPPKKKKKKNNHLTRKREIRKGMKTVISKKTTSG